MATGGRRTTNTQERDWREQLDLIWSKRPWLANKQKSLHAAAKEKFGPAVGGDVDFELKLRGKRPTNGNFARILFEAAGLDEEGLSLEAWEEGGDVWAAEVESLRASRLRDDMDRMAEDSPLSLRVTSRPFPEMTVRRATEPVDQDVLVVGQEIWLSLTYAGDNALRQMYLLVFEYLGENYEWQVFTSLGACRIRNGIPVSFSPLGKNLAFEQGIGLAASDPSPNYNLFVFASPTKFDHLVLARLGSLNPKEALISHPDLAAMINTLRKNPALMVAKAKYEIR